MNEWMIDWMSERRNEGKGGDSLASMLPAIHSLGPKLMNEWMTDWLKEWMNEWVNERMQEQMNEWMNEWVNKWMPNNFD